MESQVSIGFTEDYKDMWFEKESVEFEHKAFLAILRKHNLGLKVKSGTVWLWSNGDIILELDSNSMVDDKFFVSDLRVQGSVDAVSELLTDLRFMLDRYAKYV